MEWLIELELPVCVGPAKFYLKNVPFPQTQTSGLISKARYNFLWFWVGVTVGHPRHEQLTVLITFVWATEERGLCILPRVLSV